MPTLARVQALTASQRGYNPFQGWQYEYAPYDCVVRVLINHTGASGTVQGSVSTGSQQIMERSPLTGGGTAGTWPSPLNVPAIEFVASAGDRIGMAIDETGGVTPTVNTVIQLDPR